MCLPHLLRISNDTVEWLGVFMDNGFTCTESRLQLQRKTRSGKQSARPHDVADAPPSECVRERRVRGTQDVSAAPLLDLETTNN